MSQLSLSSLGLGPVAASPWLLLLLVGASWLLAHVLAWTYTFYDNRRRLQCFPQPPKRNWFWGHMGLVPPTEQGMRVLTQLVATHPQGFKVWMGPITPLLSLCHPDIIRSVINASAAIAPKDKFFYSFLKPWLGDGLLLSAGDKWSRHRRMLTPAFHFNILKPYMKIFNESVNIMHAKWQRLASEGNARLDMFEHISLMTLDSLQKCVFSFDSHCQDAKITTASPSLPVGRCGEDRECLHSGRNVVRAQPLPSLPHRPPRSSPLRVLSNDPENRCHSSSLPLTHDTTASGLSWVLYHLAKHPAYTRSPAADVPRPRPSPKDAHRDDLAQLPFLTMCVKESLRLHPPVPVISRRVTQDIVVPDGRVIPKGMICLISVFGTHHNPAVWPDPEVYDPFRFDPENVKERSPLAFIPFSAGPRNCIGQAFAMAEMKVVLALTLLRFRVLLDHTEPRRKPELVMRAEGGLWLRVEPRS
uniref:Cytochrome P450 family 4 subfamily F member 2 n=1 Tax=Aotus nancymaae TaxID=37293 RepID=A0A2K5DIQ5_AOTNA